ncbi:ATP-dependent metallopeptidase FtsH/Yme1/Tma family protein [Megamonas hypermegale]|uniref:ATP-dependent metallopeptidase FtsH/Yme1/Tma family protein n=1 Tax=Megamonas hypermegale TaxID=158847 RepID=UPI0026F0DF3E|nr:ATP-dependent metallopeptidase FtsH/Yme1/Tma family protein [Megamonas hypermegale]
MNEIKPPKKPLIYYYGIAFVLLILFNSLVMPFAEKHQIEEVSYNTFIQKTEDKDIGSVKIEDNEITFTDKDKSHVYCTGEMNDPDLVKRLAASGADFKNIPARQASPIENFFLNWILPILIL